jgi:tetratricopeptide (TPR) repeat protein
MLLGALATEQKDLEAGQLFYRNAAAKAEKMMSTKRVVEAHQSWINLLVAHKKYNEAERLCKVLLEMRGSADDEDSVREAYRAILFGLETIVKVYAVQGKTDDAQKMLDSFAKRDPDNIFVLENQGWLYRYTEKYDEAVKVYEKIMTHIDKIKAPPDEKAKDKFNQEKENLKDQQREILGSLYSEMGDIDKATEYLQDVLKRKPEDATLNNDLGYIWADHDRNLDEAEKMIAKALAKEPKNPSYLDSMAWVLFKKKKFAEAKKYILEAVEIPRGNNTEILDHMGDIHAALKERDEAAKAWKKAIEVATPSARDQRKKAEVEKKLKALSDGP